VNEGEPKPIDWARIFKWLGEKYHWASPEAVGSLTMTQLNVYLAKEDQQVPEGSREIEFWEVNKVAEEFRKRKGIPEPQKGG
jgi:hypothetical protein